METKFTKSPWKFNAHDGSITDCTKAENEISTVQLDDWYCLGMGYSNAHLIAAAPEMYHMLNRVIQAQKDADNEIEHSDLMHFLYDDIEKLLAKARGER